MPVYALGDETPDIDPTAFVHPDRRTGYQSLVRFAFCKKVELLELASAQLAGLRS